MKTALEVATMFNESGVAIHSYSGRGMYGSVCLSIHEAPLQAIHRVVDCGEVNDFDDLAELLETIELYNSDQLGLGMVYYWPRLEWTEEMEALVGPGTFEPDEE